METAIFTAILAALLVLISLVVVVLLRAGRGAATEGVQAALRDEFLRFQSNIHSEMNTARQGVEGAKDVMSQNALKTLETLQRLVQQQEEAQRLGQSLKDLLQAPKLRGSYGEMILEELLDRVLPRGVWERQYKMEGGEVVDCIVRFRDVVVPIDAKFPRNDYMRYSESESKEDKTASWKGFEAAIRSQIASIKAKYVKPEQGTTEFALMFIPSEAIYYETIAEKNHLGQPSAILEYAQQNHVLPVSPNTFYAFLQIVMLSLKNVEILRNAKQLQEGLARLEKDFRFFHERFEGVGTAIGRASEAYRVGSGHVDRYKRRLDETLQLEALQGAGPQLQLAVSNNEATEMQQEDS